MTRRCAMLSWIAAPLAGAAEEWKAGAARAPMTPRGPMFMAGYGARKRPSEGVAQELFAKALALEDPGGTRAVIVTTDMLGFPASLSKAIAERVKGGYGIPRERLMLNSSHTHCGPAITGMQAQPGYNMTPKDVEAVDAYTNELKEKLVAVIGEAIANLAPARLSFGKTLASFGVHRRMPGGLTWGPNYAGPADHDVPVLRVDGAGGSVRAVVFGYACHNSSIGIMKFHGDYAGSAQKWLEERHPGAVALFMMGCGGDVKPYPNNSVELTESYGAVLGASVDAHMHQRLRPVGGKLEAVFETVMLPFAEPPTRERLKERLANGNALVKRYAETMLRTLDRDGRLPVHYPYPLQVWQFGKDLTLVSMAGEVVSQYALRLNKDLGGEKLWVAAYSNDVFAYIPSRQIIEEGGYEGATSMEFYLQPAPWQPSIEETVIGKVHELVGRVRAR